MPVVFEGQGSTFTMSGLTLAPKKITVPGWSKEEIEITNLNNTDVKTFILAKLKKIKDLVLSCEYDPSAVIPEGNQTVVINFAGTTENITFWADVKETGDVDMNTDEQPVEDITLTVTNVNDSGVETPPAYSAT